MSALGDGGLAFPIYSTPESFDEHGGMTLRDYFAAKALQGMLSNPGSDSSGTWQDAESSAVAGAAYDYADAMLKARQA